MEMVALFYKDSTFLMGGGAKLNVIMKIIITLLIPWDILFERYLVTCFI